MFMDYGRYCKAARLSRGMTLTQASIASGVPEATISSAERGSSDLDASQVVALACAYGMSTDELLTGAYVSGNGEWGKVESLCDWFGISKSKAYRLVRTPEDDGGVPNHMVGGTAMLYKPEVYAWAMSKVGYAKSDTMRKRRK